LLAVALASASASAYASGTHAQGALGGSLVELCNSESQTDNLVCTALIIGTTSGMHSTRRNGRSVAGYRSQISKGSPRILAWAFPCHRPSSA